MDTLEKRTHINSESHYDDCATTVRKYRIYQSQVWYNTHHTTYHLPLLRKRSLEKCPLALLEEKNPAKQTVMNISSLLRRNSAAILWSGSEDVALFYCFIHALTMSLASCVWHLSHVTYHSAGARQEVDSIFICVKYKCHLFAKGMTTKGFNKSLGPTTIWTHQHLTWSEKNFPKRRQQLIKIYAPKNGSYVEQDIGQGLLNFTMSLFNSEKWKSRTLRILQESLDQMLSLFV